MASEHGPRSPVGAVPARTVTVRIAGGERREAPLTWSQQYYLAELDAARLYGRSLAVLRLYPLRPGVSEDEVMGALRGLVERYESLRSRVVRTDAPGQCVDGHGELAVAVHDLAAATAADIVEVTADTVLADLARRPFEVGEEWPLRAAVVGVGGQPRFLAIAFSHVAVDAFALLPISAYLVGRCAQADPVARTTPGSGGEGLQPCEQAEAEASPAGQRAAQRALRHAEEVLRRLPAASPAAGPAPVGSATVGSALVGSVSAGPVSADPASTGPAPVGEPYRFLRRRSAAFDLAVGAAAARSGQSPAAVIAAAMMAVDAARTGERYGFVQLISANRLRPQTVGAVVPCSQPVLCWVDTHGASFTELVRRTASASLRAYRAGPCPPAALAELRAAVEEDRGTRLDLPPVLNYRPRATTLPVRETDAAELRRAAADAGTAWVDGDLLWQADHYLSADVDGSGVRLLLQIDTRVRSPRWAEQWAAELERVLCAAATSETAARAPALPA